jgi:hypothetical protein
MQVNGYFMDPTSLRFYNNPSVRKYRELYLKGKKIDNATVSGFYDAVNILAQGVFSHYRDDPDEVVTVDFLNSYNSYISLDFFINILAPKEGGYGTTVVAPKKK